MNSSKRNKFEIGDLVTLDNDYYFINAYQIESLFEGGRLLQSVHYKLFSAYPSGNPLKDNAVGYEEDLIFVTDAIQAEEFIRHERPRTKRENKYMNAAYDGYNDSNKNNKKSDKGKSKQNNNKVTRTRQKQLEEIELTRKREYKERTNLLLDQLSNHIKNNNSEGIKKVKDQLHNLMIIYDAGGYYDDEKEDGKD